MDELPVDIEALSVQVARDVEAELGNWMLGQIGSDGLRDAVPDACEEFYNLSAWDQEHLIRLVEAEIFG